MFSPSATLSVCLSLCPPSPLFLRKLSTFDKHMQQNGYETDQIWRDIEDVVIKTLISAHPVIKHNYLTCFPNHTMWSACFEILGFDILLDRKLKPWLLEVCSCKTSCLCLGFRNWPLVPLFPSFGGKEAAIPRLLC